MKGLHEYFSGALGLPVERWNPFESLTGGDSLANDLGSLAPQFSAAVGLALRQE
jgi:Tfp pilus assembly PilM family ATPase